MLKRGHKGAYHRVSWRHLNGYVNEFTGRHNQRELLTPLTRWSRSYWG
ncbi:MAG: hypothetical protein OXG83_15615 [Acidobacteria bacterium]|nr:hypothetical protein [Acidobacteriota bacterium]